MISTSLVTKPSDSLLCPVCQEVYVDPLISRVCNHSFCNGCIFRSLEVEAHCPVCRAWLKKEDLHSNLALRNICDELQVYCANKPAGCDVIMRREHIENHQNECAYTQQSCPNQNLGCVHSGPKISMADHLETCPFETMKGYIMKNESRANSLLKLIEEQQATILELRKLILQSSTKGAHAPVVEIEEEDLTTKWPNGDIECRRTITDFRTGVTSLAFYDGRLYSGAYDGTIKVFDTNSGHLIKSNKGHILSVWTVAVHSTSDRLFTAGSDGFIKAWSLDTQNSQCLQSFANQQRKVYSMIIDNDRLFAGLSDGRVLILDVNTFEMIGALEGHSEGINSLKILSNGRLASASSDKSIKIWDVATGVVEKTLTDFASEVLDVSFGEGTLFGSCYDSSIVAFDISSYSRTRTLRGHNWEVWQLCYTDGVLFSGSHDHTIKRWDPRMFVETATLKGHKGYVHSLINGEGCLISGCADKTIKIWS